MVCVQCAKIAHELHQCRSTCAQKNARVTAVVHFEHQTRSLPRDVEVCRIVTCESTVSLQRDPVRAQSTSNWKDTPCSLFSSRIRPRRIVARPNMLGQSPPKYCKTALWGPLNGNWSSFQLANSTPPQSVIDRARAPSARMSLKRTIDLRAYKFPRTHAPASISC